MTTSCYLTPLRVADALANDLLRKRALAHMHEDFRKQPYKKALTTTIVSKPGSAPGQAASGLVSTPSLDTGVSRRVAFSEVDSRSASRNGERLRGTASILRDSPQRPVRNPTGGWTAAQHEVKTADEPSSHKRQRYSESHQSANQVKVKTELPAHSASIREKANHLLQVSLAGRVTWFRFGRGWYVGRVADLSDDEEVASIVVQVVEAAKPDCVLVQSYDDGCFSWVPPQGLGDFRTEFSKNCTNLLKTQKGKLALGRALYDDEWTQNEQYAALTRPILVDEGQPSVR